MSDERVPDEPNPDPSGRCGECSNLIRPSCECSANIRICEEQQRAERAEKEIEKLRAKPERWESFAKFAAQRMADAINRLVLLKRIDSRSEAADAALDWADPDFERLDEIEQLRAKLSSAEEEIEQMRLAAVRSAGYINS